MGNSFSSKMTDFLTATGATVKSGLRLVAGARPIPSFVGERGENPLVILGNGPSLRRNIEEDMPILKSCDTLAVNFAANAPEFHEIKPKYYLLADPHFFEKADTDPNVSRLMANLNAVDFPMTLFVPARSEVPGVLSYGDNLKIERYNFVAVEGYKWFENMMFVHGYGMPRPRNVLIPSIMVGMWLGYKRIYLLGADHSWLSTLTVNDRNEVVSIQPHFYKEDEREETRVREEYVRHPLHEVLDSMRIAFQSYHRIQQYAKSRGVEIRNATPGSMIDAFPRSQLLS